MCVRSDITIPCLYDVRNMLRICCTHTHVRMCACFDWNGRNKIIINMYKHRAWQCNQFCCVFECDTKQNRIRKFNFEKFDVI